MLNATTIGTICHNDDNAMDADHRRIEIWVEGGQLLADRNNPQNHGDAKDVNEAVRMASQLWSGREWDFRLDAALDQ